jgi:hypothetical protein
VLEVHSNRIDHDVKIDEFYSQSVNQKNVEHISIQSKYDQGRKSIQELCNFGKIVEKVSQDYNLSPNLIR